MKRLRLELQRLEERRRAVKQQEDCLQKVVGDFILEQPGSLREKATKMDFTVAYLSDIVNGRRKISSGVMERLERING